MGKRTKSRIEHVQRHRVALLCPRDRHKSLIAVVLWFVDLDYTSTQVSNLVDLRAAFAYDSAYHIIGNKDLLSKWLTR